MTSDAVRDLLLRQGGLARRRDLLAAGASRRQLAGALRSGHLLLVGPHLLADPSVADRWQALRAAAVGLDAVVSRTSAAQLLGIELAVVPAFPEVTVARDRSRARAAGVRVLRQDLPSADVEEREGLRCTTPLRTVLDLSRALPLAEAVVACDSALRRGLVRPEELSGALRDLPPGRGRPAVGRVLRLVDPESGSVLESLCRVLLVLAGLPPERTQLGIRGVGRVDFAWPSVRLVVEVDGFAFHADRAAYRGDRRRTNALVLAGWRVLRFSWEDVVGSPDRVVEAVRRSLQEPLAVAS